MGFGPLHFRFCVILAGIATPVTGFASTIVTNETYVQYEFLGGSSGYVQNDALGNEALAAVDYVQGLGGSGPSEISITAFQAPDGKSHVAIDSKLWDGEDPAEITALASLIKTYTNTGTSTQDYTYDFTVSGGYMRIEEYNNADPNLTPPWEQPAPPYSNGLRLEYTIRTRDPGTAFVEIYRAYYDLWGAGGSYSGESEWLSGAFVPHDPSCYCDGGTVTLPTLTDSIMLGKLAPGETGIAEISLKATAIGPGAETELEVRLSDPNQISGNLIAAPAAVPLPAGMPLLAGAIAGLAILRQRRRRV